MISVYNDMSDLDAKRIGFIVDSLEKVFDEDNSGTVGKIEIILSKHELTYPMYDTIFDHDRHQ